MMVMCLRFRLGAPKVVAFKDKMMLSGTTCYPNNTSRYNLTSYALRTYSNKKGDNGGYMSYSSDRDNESGGF